MSGASGLTVKRRWPAIWIRIYPPKKRDLPGVILYPFGLNQSQKIAVEHALSSQVSIIQGPPGTGKTQTILNIIANAVRNGKTVAVVSNNNAATLNVAEKNGGQGPLVSSPPFWGSRANKEHFLETQTGEYPNMESWVLEPEEQQRLSKTVAQLSQELNQRLDAKNRIAAIQQELLELTPEEHNFASYYENAGQAFRGEIKNLSAQETLSLWLEYEAHAENGKRLGLLKKFSIWLRFNRSALTVFGQAPEVVIPYLQRQFYQVRRQELTDEREHLEKMLEHYSFDEKMEELTDLSLCLFRAELSRRFRWKGKRPCFDVKSFWGDPGKVNADIPVILSTTHSIKGTLHPDHVYDYLIVDEASQVDLATGVLALSCAKNVVIVGDLQQLPNVLDGDNHPKERGGLEPAFFAGGLPFLDPQPACLCAGSVEECADGTLAGALPLPSQNHQFLQSEILWGQTDCHDRGPRRTRCPDHVQDAPGQSRPGTPEPASD